MNLDNVLAAVGAVGKMFPSVNLNEAAQKAQEAISGTADSLDSVSAAAQRLGISRQTVDDIYRRYGGTMHARAVCGLLGTTPEALKADAEKILGGGGAPFPPPQNARKGTVKFPRLK